MDGWRTESTEKVERNKRKGGGGKRKREACQPMFSESVYSRSRSPVTSCSNDLIAVCRAHTNQGIDMCTLSPALRETGPKSFAGAQRHNAFHIFREKNKKLKKKQLHNSPAGCAEEPTSNEALYSKYQPCFRTQTPPGCLSADNSSSPKICFLPFSPETAGLDPPCPPYLCSITNVYHKQVSEL